MKYVMYGMASIVCVVLALLCWTAVEQRTYRETEMQQALREAVMESLDQVMLQGKYTVESREDLVADFTELLVRRIHLSDSGVSLQVDITGVDEKKGLLSVQVTETFTHPNGRIGSCETAATVVLEQEETRELFEVCYQLPEEVCSGTDTPLPRVHKRYLLEEGTQLMVPKNPPDVAGKKFLAWADADGRTYTKAQLEKIKVNSVLTLTAIYG